jgi:hypothetical protein
MSYRYVHYDMLECDISGKTDRSFLHISWDAVNKQYALGLRVYNGRAQQTSETIYLDFETTSLMYQTLPEVLSILNKFNNHEITPLPNYFAAYRLSHLALHPHDRKNWNACEFDLSDG